MVTNIHITKDGHVKYYGDSLSRFAVELVEKVCPMLDSYATCIFKGIRFFVYKNDNIDSIMRNWGNEYSRCLGGSNMF